VIPVFTLLESVSEGPVQAGLFSIPFRRHSEKTLTTMTEFDLFNCHFPLQEAFPSFIFDSKI
jgi:hypothetical protein